MERPLSHDDVERLMQLPVEEVGRLLANLTISKRILKEVVQRSAVRAVEQVETARNNRINKLSNSREFVRDVWGGF